MALTLAQGRVVGEGSWAKALEQHVTGFLVEHVELALKQLNPKLKLKLELDVDVDWDVEPALK